MTNILITHDTPEIKKTVSELRNSRRNSVAIWIAGNLARSEPYKYWKDKHVVETNASDCCGCLYLWNVVKEELEQVDNCYRKLVWRIQHDNMQFHHLCDTLPAKNTETLLHDSKINTNLPEFIKIPCFDNISYLGKLIPFSLDDTDRFERTAKMYQGQSIYKEKATGRLWYLDNLHKDHYEVFDARGKTHLGEATPQGRLDTTKSDPQKTLLHL